MSNVTRIGVAVAIFDTHGRILVGKRLGKSGYGTWCAPGGMVEFGESIEQAARREMREEIGVEVTDLKLRLVTNDVIVGEHDTTQYITAWFNAWIKDGDTPINMEPEKCAGWEWHPVFDVPKPHFQAFTNYLNELVKKRTDPTELTQRINGDGDLTPCPM